MCSLMITDIFACGLLSQPLLKSVFALWLCSRYECVEWAVGLSGRHKGVRGVRKADGKTVLIRQLSTRDKA